MNQKILSVLLIILFAGCTAQAPLTPANTPLPAQNRNGSTQQTVTQQPEPVPVASTASGITMPLTNTPARINAKPFGIYVAPLNSPVQPGEHIGYHAGTDFEIFPDEINKDVPVFAICTGKILVKRLMVQGYGGVLVESCNLDNQPITVAYGHLKVALITKNVGDTLTAGESFAILGNDYSDETGGERKHLHLGIKKGTAIDVHGYVQNKSDLSDWVDFRRLL